MVHVRRSARRFPRLLVSLLGLAVVVPLALVWSGGVALADPTVSDLQRQLRGLNSDADQAVERYLDAKIQLQQARAQLASLQTNVDAARRQLEDLRRLVSSQAADAYMFGPADLALMLDPGTTDDTLDRMQTLTLLAERANDQLTDLGTAERAFNDEMARLRKFEQAQQEQVKRLAAEKDKVDRLVQRTQTLLAELRQTGGAGAVDGVDPGVAAGSVPPPPTGSGGAGPDAFDCSGLTMMAWRQGGIALPHSAAGQFGVGRRVTRAELQPGDLIFRYSPISHVAMYVGGGMQIAATHTGSTVKFQSAFQGPIVGYSRPNG